MTCKHMSGCCPKMAEWGLLALRAAVGFVFIYSGYSKLFVNLPMTIGAFTGMGFPVPAFLAYLVGILELVGGIMVLLGVYARYAATWLAIIMIVAMLTAHRTGPVQGFFLPLSLLGGCLALAGVGAGAYRLVKNECPCPKCKMMGKEMGGCCTDDKNMKGGCCGGCSEEEMKKDEKKDAMK